MFVTLDANGKPDFDIEGVQLGAGENAFAEFRAAGKQGPIVTFSAKGVESKVASLQNGRPMLVPQLMVRIQHPGERDWLEVRAEQHHCMKYREEYKAFCQGREGAPKGTPLSVLFPHMSELVDMLKHNKVHTVEQLAGLNDTAAQYLGMGGVEWRAKAQEYLEESEKAQPFVQLKEEIRKLSDDAQRARAREAELIAELRNMQQQNAKMAAAMAMLPGGGQFHLGAAPGAGAGFDPQATFQAPYTPVIDGGMMAQPPGSVPLPGGLPLGMQPAPAPQMAPSPIEEELHMPEVPGMPAHEAPRQGGSKKR